MLVHVTEGQVTPKGVHPEVTEAIVERHSIECLRESNVLLEIPHSENAYVD
jgi:hypothetical protein